MMRLPARAPSLLLALPFLATFSLAHPPALPAQQRTATADTTSYSATIRRTSFGVPHIEARDLPSLGFGEGYAQAEDHVCTIADQVVRARGERARYFGRGEGDVHLRSDIVMRGLRVHEKAAELLAREPQEIRAWVNGFAAGYNHYLAQTGRTKLPEWCRDQEWVMPITAADIAAMYRATVLRTVNMLDPIATARPPAAPATGGDASTGSAADTLALLHALAATSAGGASNGWAIGRERSASGRGMLLANPHYPWVGANRFWEKHLRIPGQLDVYGANNIGGLGVLLGFNDAVAWTHTTSNHARLTAYFVELVPDNPTRYRYGSEQRDMERREVTVQVRGEAEPLRHTVYVTHHGPVISFPQLPWTAQRAMALRDPNEDNLALFRHTLATNRARSMDELRRAYAEHQAVPWIHTVAVSADGVAWYADGSNTPNLSDSVLADWRQRAQSDLITRTGRQGGLVLLNGSDPATEWVQHPDARRPGLVPFSRAPQLERTDYIINANDSYWLPNASARIEGDFSPLYGSQRTALSVRTRSNVMHLENTAPHRPAGADGRFTLRELQDAALANHGQTAELLVAELVERCGATPRVTVDGAEVDVSEGCGVLARWNRRYDPDSRGAVLFREWLGRYPNADFTRRGNLFAEEFDPANAVVTPRGLAPGPLAVENLARAVTLLRGRGIALDVPLGELQYAPSKMPRRIPVHGGNFVEGVLNMVLDAGSGRPSTLEPLQRPAGVQGSPFLTEAGYPILHGTSFLMALEYTAEGPRAMAFLTYGQSGDPASEHFADQTELFARKQWRPIPFRQADISAGVRREYTVIGPRSEAQDAAEHQ